MTNPRQTKWTPLGEAGRKLCPACPGTSEAQLQPHARPLHTFTSSPEAAPESASRFFWLFATEVIFFRQARPTCPLLIFVRELAPSHSHSPPAARVPTTPLPRCQMSDSSTQSKHDDSRGRWRRWFSQLVAPQIDQQTLDERLREARATLPPPVVWLFGKAQSGKTSIIRALTGSSQAEIGNGFRPCTRTAQVYPFPDADEPLLEFLDTRGLGEVDYDPSEDIEVFSRRAHVLIVVVKALDHAQSAVLQPLREILRTHSDWPVIVVQTCLHEAYPGREHPTPYPFGVYPFPPSVPSDLARSLAHQRDWFRGQNVRFVPIDFTLPEDGFADPFYGIDALWDAIESVLPWGLRAMLRDAATGEALRNTYRQLAERHILSYALAAGAVAALPVPMIDVPLILGIQGKLCHSIASIYGESLSAQRIAEISGSLGAGYLARLGGRELLKLVPGWGTAVAATYAAATTYALGQMYVKYFESVQQGYLPDAASLRSMYDAQFEQGRRKMRRYLEHALARRTSPH